VNRVDKARLGAAFSRGAAAYDEHARVQRAVVDQVLALARAHAPRARRALDVGAGTGALLERLLAERPGVAACGVDLAPGMARAAAERTGRRHAVGDAEALPVATGSIDLLVSTSTFQWLPRLEPAFAEAARALAPGGTCVVALFGDDTLHELGAAWRRAIPAGAPDRLHRFHRRAAVEAAVAGAGLAPVHVEVARHVERHPDVLSLLRTLRRIGAGNAAPDRPRALSEAHVVARMIAAYEALRGPEGVPATWDVVAVVGRKP
jgi:malonyl-CoA O-methyltransferase